MSVVVVPKTRYRGRNSRWRLGVGAAAVMSVVFASGIDVARAQNANPCARDASSEQPDKAQAVLRQAFELHKQLQFEESGEKYQEALQFSRDPRIHLQAGIVFLSALRLLDAFKHLDIALRCGRRLMSEEEYLDAQQMMKRVRKRLGQIEVHNGEAGADVRFNDVHWFSEAGPRTRMVVAGEYLVTVKKPGFVTVLAPVNIQSGKRAIVKPNLLTVGQATIVTRPFKRWQPWTLLGVGAFLSLVGGGLEWHASRSFDAYERDLRDACMPRCPIDIQTSLQRRFDTATWENRLAVGSLIVGGTAMAVGLTLAFLNRPRSRLRDTAGKANVKIVPMVSERGAGLSVGGRFSL